jgi:hypothetical protein
MITFQELYEESQAQTEDASADSLTLIKRALNQGAKQFGAILNREWRNTNKTFSLVEDQQYYQTPEDCIRMKSLVVTIGGTSYVLQEVPDEDTWNLLNETVDTSNIPEFFYVRGNDEFGIYPIPSANGTNAGRINYERRMRDMSAANYTTGTITVTLNSATVIGADTTFTAAMVGRSLKVNDPNGDGMWYKIAAFVDANTLTLENTYAGATANTLSYTIGELPDIPEEFHESLIDYALYRYYQRRRDWNAARALKSSFIEALASCQANYSSKTASQYTRPIRLRGGYIHQRRNYEVI